MRHWIFLAGLLAPISCAVAATVDKTTSYYTVRGSTLEELDRQLERRGPRISDAGDPHPGVTEVQFDGQIDYLEAAGRCAVDEVDLRLDLNITLPQWKPPRRVDRSTYVIWSTLEEDIRRHEERHAGIAVHHVRLMEMAIRNLRSERDCTAMEAMVDRVVSRYLAEHETAQREFDKREGREMTARLRRAVDRAFRQLEE